MKKSILVIVAGFAVLSATSAYTESVTTVYNETDQAVAVTWTASKTWAKVARNVAAWFKSSKHTFIEPNGKDWFTHSGDTLVVRYVTCSNGAPKTKELMYDALGDGYGKDGLVVKWNKNNTEMMIEKRD